MRTRSVGNDLGPHALATRDVLDSPRTRQDTDEHQATPVLREVVERLGLRGAGATVGDLDAHRVVTPGDGDLALRVRDA